MIQPSKNLLLATLVLCVSTQLFFSTVQATPECRVTQPDANIINIRPGETQYKNLFDYFSGYNLNFRVDEDEYLNQYDFYQLPTKQNQKVFEANNPMFLGEIQSYDTWQRQDGYISHLVLTMDGESIYHVYHSLSATFVELPVMKEIETRNIGRSDNIFKCFELFFIDQQTAILDCLVDVSSVKYTRYYIFSFKDDGASYPYYTQDVDNYFDALDDATERKSIVFNDESIGAYIFSIIPFDSFSESKPTSFPVYVYRFLSGKNSLSQYPDGEIDSKYTEQILDFGDQDEPNPFLVDISNSEEQVYILSTERIYRFGWDGQQMVRLTRCNNVYDQNLEEETSINRFTVLDDVEDTLIMTSENNRVVIYRWNANDTDTQKEMLAWVPMRNSRDNIQELKFGEDFAFLFMNNVGDVVAFDYYDAILNAAEDPEKLARNVNLVHLDYQNELNVVFATFSQDYLIVMSEAKYGIYFFSDPIFQITHPDVTDDNVAITEQIVVYGKSQDGNQFVECSIKFQVIPVINDDGTQIFKTGLNQNYNYIPGQMANNQKIPTNGEYEGPNVQLFASVDGTKNNDFALTSFNMLSLQNSTFQTAEPSDTTSFLYMWTYPYRVDVFYMFTQNTNNELKADKCYTNVNEYGARCLPKLIKAIQLADKVKHFAVDVVATQIIYAVTYVGTASNKIDIFFVNGTQFATKTYEIINNNEYITDIEMINGYLFVSQNGIPNIDVYIIDFNMKNPPIFQMNENTVGKWPGFGDIKNDWKHLAAYSHVELPNLLFLETSSNLVEIQIIQDRPHYVATYDLKSTRGENVDRLIAVTEKSILVAVVTRNAQTKALTQSVFEIFNDDPVDTKRVEGIAPFYLYNLKLTFPIIGSNNYFGNNFFFVATVGNTLNDYRIVSIQSDTSDVNRINFVVPLQVVAPEQNPLDIKLILDVAGYFNDYLYVVQPGTPNYAALYMARENKLLYNIDEKKVNFKSFTGQTFLKIDVSGGVPLKSQQTRNMDIVIQNPQTSMAANPDAISKTLNTSGKGISNKNLGKSFQIDDSGWFSGAVLGCKLLESTPNYASFAVADHLEYKNNTIINGLYGAIDMIQSQSYVIVLLNNGTIYQLSPTLALKATFNIPNDLLQNASPTQLVAMDKDLKSVMVFITGNIQSDTIFTLVIDGFYTFAPTSTNQTMTLTSKYPEFFQVYVYNSTYLFLGMGRSPRFQGELGMITVYKIDQVKGEINSLFDVTAATFFLNSLSISGFHLEDGLYNNSEQMLFVLGQTGEAFSLLELSLGDEKGAYTRSHLNTNFKGDLRASGLFWDDNTRFFGLSSVNDKLVINKDSFNITLRIATSNTGIYEIEYEFDYTKFAQNTEPKVRTRTIFNNYGPKYQVQHVPVELNNYLLVLFKPVQRLPGSNDLVAVFDRNDPSYVIVNPDYNTRLYKLRASLNKAESPYLIDLLTMISNPDNGRPNVIFLNQNIDTKTMTETQALMAATYHDNITIYTFNNKFPEQVVNLEFSSSYTSPLFVNVNFYDVPDDPSPKPSDKDQNGKDLEVLWILLGVFGGLLLLAGGYILFKRHLLKKQEDIQEIQDDNEQNYEKLN